MVIFLQQTLISTTLFVSHYLKLSRLFSDEYTVTALLGSQGLVHLLPKNPNNVKGTESTATSMGMFCMKNCWDFKFPCRIVLKMLESLHMFCAGWSRRSVATLSTWKLKLLFSVLGFTLLFAFQLLFCICVFLSAPSFPLLLSWLGSSHLCDSFFRLRFIRLEAPDGRASPHMTVQSKTVHTRTSLFSSFQWFLWLKPLS